MNLIAQNPTRAALYVCLAVLAVHWLNQLGPTYGLMYDEAQYWFWGKHPAFGYYSKPPMIAWAMGLSTALFGDHVFGVRLLAPVLQLGTGLVLAATARLLGQSRDTAAWVLMIYVTLPLVSVNSNFFATDVPLLLCWSVALYAAIKAITVPGAGRWWLVVGLASGLGLLSKYTMVAFGASVLLALITVPGARRQFASPWLWLGVLLALALFAPNLWWNAAHQFVTFQHTEDNVITKQVTLYQRDLLIFTAAPLLLFGPWLSVALVRSLRGARSDATLRSLHLFVWPLALTGILISALASAQAQWISPCYAAGTLAAVLWLRYTGRGHWLHATLCFNLAMLALFYATPSLLPHLPTRYDPLARITVWNTLAEPVAQEVARYPDAVLVTDERKAAAALTYQLRALRGTQTPVYKWPTPQVRDHYDLLTHETSLAGKPVLLVLRYNMPWELQPHAQLLQRLTIGRYHFALVYVPSFVTPAPPIKAGFSDSAR
ncbi:MAG: glycosyltransferase family 39 protein [Rickettsiales bacterium]